MQNGTAHATHATHATHALGAASQAKVVYPPSHLDGVNLPSHLVVYQSPTTTTTAPPVTPTTAAPAPAPAATTTTTIAPHVVVAPAPVATTTTTAPPVHAAASNHLVGEATWYGAAPPGKCASPTLPFGTVLTVTNNATGASTVCTVDDREESGYPRVVDLSYSGFSQIANPSQGVVDVTLSW